MKILQFPLARIIVAFILGILSYRVYQPTPIFVGLVLLIAIPFLLGFHYLAKANKGYKFLFGSGVLLISFTLGISTAVYHQQTLHPNHYLNKVQDDDYHEFTIIIHEKLKSTAKNSRYISTVRHIDGSESLGRIILNIRQPNQITELPIGSQLKIYGSIYKNKNPFNPNQFDYAQYLENQQIYGQLYTEERQIIIGYSQPTLWSHFSNFRTTIIQNLEQSHFRESELNIMIALLLGQQQDISPGVLKDYQLAGAVHILSVSGLHVGFILLFVTFLLKPMANTRRNSAIKLIIILLSLWSYGVLAGMAPSVVRSVTMFSFVAVGNHVRRMVNVFHTLLVSMLLILLWKPSFLFDVGFQLSYLALFFILWLQPLLAAVWQPKNKILQYTWNLLTVSFAAQIGTMPLTLYYFHQFPGLFFVTNIIVLPLLGIIMIVGLIAIIIACFGKVPLLVIKPLELLIGIQNNLIGWIASFDEFVFRNISFNTPMLWASYFLIIALILWFKKTSFKASVMAMLGVIFLQCIFIRNQFKTHDTQELIVFNSRKNSIISVRNNSWVTVYSNDSLLNTLEHNVTVQSYLIGNFCRLKEKERIKNTLYFKGKKILLIDSSAIYTEKIKPDILIIINSPKLNMERLLATFKPKQIVVDGSNFKSYARLWEVTCRKEKIPFHYTNEKGFYKI